MELDTEYGVKEEKFRVMQLLIVTDANEYYELRVDMPKGTDDEKRGTSMFQGALERLKVGKSMVVGCTSSGSCPEVRPAS